MTLNHGELTWSAAGLDHVPAGSTWMDARLAARVEHMRYHKRRSETLLARWTAKSTIARSVGLSLDDVTLAGIVVSNAFDGAPEAAIGDAPLDGVIAMTDRADWSVCMLLGGRARVGCDLELVEPRTDAFVKDYFTPAEQSVVSSHDQRDLAANLVWSAKESALKVMRTGLRRDTRTVEVTFDRGPVESWNALSVSTDDGRTFPGWWMVTGAFVLTCAAEIPTPVPRSLTRPHGLTGATPTHRWMAHLEAD